MCYEQPYTPSCPACGRPRPVPQGDREPPGRGLPLRGHGGKADGRVYAAASQRDAAAPRSKDLSAREQEVLALVAQGKSNKEIGAAIAIAENTVKNHLKSILEKLHLGNRVQVAT